jgi:hypothetical protein
MKKLLCLFASLIISHAALAQTMPLKDIKNKNTTCIDGITYFVGISFDGQFGITNYFVSSVKIDPKTMQPQICKS